MGNRIRWIDITKGMGMLLVISGHCVTLGSVIHNLIFAFHMPLFFILAGLVYVDNSMEVLVKKRIKSLIVPYLWFCVLGLIVTLIIPRWRSITLIGLLQDVYLGDPETVNVSSVWFLICLFWVTLLFAWINRINSQFVKTGILAAFLVGGLWVGTVIHNGDCRRFPLNLDVAPVALFFFAAAYFLRKQIFGFYSKYKGSGRLFFKLCSAVGLLLVFCFIVRQNGRVNLHGLTYNNWILYIIEGITGSVLLIMVVSYIEKTRLAVFFEWLGRKSILILGAQAIFVRLSVILINYCFDKDYSLYGLPMSFACLSFVFTAAGSILFAQCVTYLTESRT